MGFFNLDKNLRPKVAEGFGVGKSRWCSKVDDDDDEVELMSFIMRRIPIPVLSHALGEGWTYLKKTLASFGRNLHAIRKRKERAHQESSDDGDATCLGQTDEASTPIDNADVACPTSKPCQRFLGEPEERGVGCHMLFIYQENNWRVLQ
ncbi:hypothetical protein L484_026348 [Morus notabilis]|uniref:Uncharacterized protein n=1 Tax=Morus notabilis TaxID=981085 RepID=W9R610_9ROSA|nr:hypothetical protein L484_026348 [Morus notabilis]